MPLINSPEDRADLARRIYGIQQVILAPFDEAMMTMPWCPRHGVYAALACFDGRRLPAVVNIGSRPTVGGTHVTVEPWILDFDGDLYGRTLRLEFYTFLRPERKFDSLDELRAAILHNAEQTREFFRDR